MDLLFSSVLESADTTSSAAYISSSGFVIATIASIVLGAVIACIYMFKHSYSKNFVITLALLPVMVQVVILLVNGNLGAGIAVMGVFNLVRFRSVPGSAKDIGSVFLAMAVGLATGMGYIGLAVVLTIVVAIFNIVYVCTSFGEQKSPSKTLKITVPEDLDFEGVFEDAISKYSNDFELISVQTTNMGSLYLLEYRVRLSETGHEKEMLDNIRCLNGNLKVVLAHQAPERNVL